ncbi:MAG: phosphotransferase [Caulobacteraceae bacterium]|nr:phosphotransferase [Caulobacteraceae bacterium]
MEGLKIAARPQDVDAAWLTLALRRAGVLGEGRVTGVEARPVGNGLVGDSFRFALAYDRPEPDAPASVVGKFAAADPTSKAAGVSLNLYAREVGFYRELASTVAISTPRAFVAEIDPATQDFTLLFEDLTPARQGDQLTGCSVEDAETAMLEAAALHGPRWGDPALASLDWLGARTETNNAILQMLPAVLAGFRDRYQDVLEPEFMAVCARLPEVMTNLQADRSVPLTIQHGDFRLDNILFDVQGGRRRMATLDWQTVGLGPGLVDVAYFLSAGLGHADRRQHEGELVRRYHTELLRFGVRDYDWDACWRDYRRFAVHGVFMAVFSAIAVERTARGDEMFMTMARGGCAQALDHDTFGFWS